MAALHADSRSVLYCPTCFRVLIPFQQPGEDALNPAQMHAIDGCNSQKRDKTAGMYNECTFDSKCSLPYGFVDGFKDEVGSHTAAQKADQTFLNHVESEDSVTLPQGEGDDHCGSNWKAATSKELPPATKEVFEQTGVFACLCRHGIVEFLMEFVQSGEKYVFVCSFSFLY